MLFLRMAGNRILQLADYRLEFCLKRFWLRFTFAHFCIPLFRFVPGGVGILQMLLQKRDQNLRKMMPKSIKIHPKSIQNPSKIDQSGAQERSESDLESKSVPRVSPQEVFGAFLTPFGRFWASCWTLLGAKGVPKSSILAPGIIKSQKNEVQEGVLEKA